MDDRKLSISRNALASQEDRHLALDVSSKNCRPVIFLKITVNAKAYQSIIMQFCSLLELHKRDLNKTGWYSISYSQDSNEGIFWGKDHSEGIVVT
jgi:hypothetical protein